MESPPVTRQRGSGDGDWRRAGPDARFLEDRGTELRDGAIDANGKVSKRRDLVRAAECFRRASEMGRASAMVSWANALDDGQGVLRNSREAAKWYRRAFAAGETMGGFNLAVSYRNQGRYLPAVKWFRRTAACGDSDAEYQLALAEIYGRRGTRRTAQTLNRLLKVASSDQTYFDAAEACLMLARIYFDGWLVRINYPEAVKWLRAAAEKGSDVAIAHLRELDELR